MITIYRYTIENTTIETIDLATIPENISYESFEYEEQQIEAPKDNTDIEALKNQLKELTEKINSLEL
jgi:hypothetical protein